MREKLKIVVNERSHLEVIDEDYPSTKETFKNMDLGQIINMYRSMGYRHARENDIDWLVREDGWQKINEIIDV